MIRFILWIFSLMPLKLNHFIGSLIGRYLYFSNSKSKRVSWKNIKICFPQLNSKQQQKLLKKSLIEIGKGISELGIIWLGRFEENAQLITKTIGAQNLKCDKPVILLVPHFGCWEITGRVVSLSYPITFLYKSPENKTQAQWLVANRQQGALSMAAADKKGIRQLQRAIKKNGLIGILPDQDPGTRGSVLAPFFAQDARTMTLLVRLARKNNAKVIVTWARRLDGGRGFELNFKAVNILSKSGDIGADVALMNQAIEALIKTQPEQYLWNYKRFKSLHKY